MVWNAAEEERLEEEAEALLTERYEIADEYFFKKKFLKNLADPQLKRLLGTPLLLFPKKERDAYYQLFIDSNEAQDFAIIDGKRYNRQVVGLSLADVIRRRLLKFDANLDSDSFEVTPVFSLKNDTDIMTGFIAFIRDPSDDHHIIDISLFSFNIHDKSFGKQVWEDFDEQIISYLSRGYKIEWKAHKENRACRHYDDLIEQFDGYKKELENSCIKYTLG